MEQYFLIGLFWIALSVIWGLVARKKGRSFLAIFALSIFVTPIIGMIVALLLQPTDAVKMAVKTGTDIGSIGPVPCPYCKEQIRPDAVVCKHCGKDVEPAVDRILQEDQERADRAEAARMEREQRAEQKEKERAAKFDKWRKKPAVKWTALGVVILVVAGIAIPFVVGAISSASEEQRMEAAKAEAAVLLEQLGQWDTIVEACGEPPAAISNVTVASGNERMDFDVAIDVVTPPGKLTTIEMSPETKNFLNCLDSALGNIALDASSGSATLVPSVTGLGKIMANALSKDNDGKVGSDFQGTFVESKDGYSVSISGPSFDNGMSISDVWHVRVTKSPQFGQAPSQ